MKQIFFILIVVLFSSCEQETLPKFQSVREMLKESSDFHEENGSLKFISEEESNVHVQVSKSILETESRELKEEIVKRDIIYVVFQSFAQTNIDQITVTAIPNDWEDHKKYYDEYAKTVKVSRKDAIKVLEKYLYSTNFSILYEKKDGSWFPNKNFSKLKFEKLKEVFNEIYNP
ncbi:hypothetical protein U8527_18165 [Kordia algicida OT-1]|uniref:Lipoprotein n=1 Tax=Kordia algicida OT-1 TaxID=391587 RepID=A9DIJ9_9FLAO|nr:hypothetical protein [Kordia algicida]EDP97918.1 hypothetical protein KAOT1_11912 [Kordia algicida OT-1]